MKTLVIHSAKDLRVEQRSVASPGENQVRVSVAYGGICGSDLHYYNHGGFGAIRLREPMILGHEVAGIVEKVGEGVADLKPGDAVAVSPSRPCGSCQYCRENLANHCQDMRFYGSAMPFPHIQGAFRQQLLADAGQCHVLNPGIPLEIGAMAEPFAVALHACARAGDLSGRRVLVTGSGPIGALCIVAARQNGASEIVVTDIQDGVLELAARLGADRVVNTRTDPDALAAYREDKGYFDVMFEASGNELALRQGLDTLRPRGILTQLGLGGDVSIPQNTIVAKEVDMRGTFRFHEEFAVAVALINARSVDLRPLVTHRFPLSRAAEAFEIASDRSKAMKVILDFGLQQKG